VGVPVNSGTEQVHEQPDRLFFSSLSDKRRPLIKEQEMNWKYVSLIAVSTLALALFMSVGTPAAPTTAAAGAVRALPSQPAAEPAATPEPHPEIREAIAALRRAKDHMEHAAHDFGGHRVEAIKATDEAIRQLQDCLKFDKD
jgi:hypothetical protein